MAGNRYQRIDIDEGIGPRQNPRSAEVFMYTCGSSPKPTRPDQGSEVTIKSAIIQAKKEATVRSGKRGPRSKSTPVPRATL